MTRRAEHGTRINTWLEHMAGTRIIFCRPVQMERFMTEMDLLAKNPGELAMEYPGEPGPGHGVSGDLRKRLLHVADDDHAPVR